MKLKSSINIRGAPEEEDNFSREPQYCSYRFTLKELIINIIFYCAFIAIVSYLFYHSAVAFIILMPTSILLLKNKKSELCSREGTGISACSFSLDWDAVRHRNRRNFLKKKLFALGILALATGIIVAVKKRKKFAEAN